MGWVTVACAAYAFRCGQTGPRSPAQAAQTSAAHGLPGHPALRPSRARQRFLFLTFSPFSCYYNRVRVPCVCVNYASL